MKYWLTFGAALLLVASGAFLFRVADLEARPMHTDEAVHAAKFAALWEEGVYRYDPYEYHGPVLNYVTLPVAWLSPEQNYEEMRAFTYRLVVVLFGTALILPLWLLGRNGLGPWAAVGAGVFTAVSHAMVFYSRYYIQEMILVFFTFVVIAAGWRYVQTRSAGWAVVAGAGFGLMHATKETCIIAYAALGGGVVFTSLWYWWRAQRSIDLPPFRHLGLAAGVALGVSVLFFSSFFTYFRGPVDSVLTYFSYVDRAGDSVHVHPWHFYLEMLLYFKSEPGPWWSEGLIVALFLVGTTVAISGKGLPAGANLWLVRFLAIFTILLTLAYTVIPYKTPWLLLGFFHGMILLAGVGLVALVRAVPTLPGKGIVCLLAVFGAYHLAEQAWRGSTEFSHDPRNPYVYAQSGNDVIRLADRVRAVSDLHPDGRNMTVKVVSPTFWPLPWYLRDFNQIGYWSDDPGDIGLDTPVVITYVESDPGLADALAQTHMMTFFGLRPGVLMELHIRDDLWDQFIESIQ